MTLQKKRMITGYLFILPLLIGFLLFFGKYLLETILYSLSEITFTDSGYSQVYVGLDNYKFAFLRHAKFNRTLVESVGNMLIDVPLIIFFSLFVALLINKKFPGRTLVRAILFLPVIMTTAAITTAMSSSLSEMMGGLNSVASMDGAAGTEGLNATVLMDFLVEFGLPEQIGEYIIGAVSRIYDIVRSSGVQILIFLASLQSISPALYEVAKLEGATGYEIFWKITFPMVSPLIVTNMVYTIVDMFSQAEILELAQNTAFSELNFGLSAAMSLVSAAVVALVIGIAVWLVSKKVFYQN